jgi:hypothetical protein
MDKLVYAYAIIVSGLLFIYIDYKKLCNNKKVNDDSSSDENIYTSNKPIIAYGMSYSKNDRFKNRANTI